MDIKNAEFPQNTLGFYHHFCLNLLGPDSAATLYLVAEAAKSPEGFETKVAEERQAFMRRLQEIDANG